jgi:hypothetical protein
VSRGYELRSGWSGRRGRRGIRGAWGTGALPASARVVSAGACVRVRQPVGRVKPGAPRPLPGACVFLFVFNWGFFRQPHSKERGIRVRARVARLPLADLATEPQACFSRRNLTGGRVRAREVDNHSCPSAGLASWVHGATQPVTQFDLWTFADTLNARQM